MNITVDPRRPATVLHTSDCHLGTSARREEEAAFERAIALARDERVDAVLVAGDLFDHIRVSEETLRWTAEQLDTLACPVVVIRGNHDVFDGRSVHERLMTAAALEHVHVYLEVRDHPTPVRYPGATATSRGGTPGVVLVDFIPGIGARPRWVALG